MKTILCYGDSNTWGAEPGGIGRYVWEDRWPGILQKQLGQNYRVVEEGLGGRTTCFDDPFSPNRNGLSYLPVVLESHSPIDLLIIMLGTNDMKARFNLTPYTIGQGAAALLMLAKDFQPAIRDILLVAPPHTVQTNDAENTYAFEGAIAKSRELAKHYHYFATQLTCLFFDASSAAQSSTVDGIHLDQRNHSLLAQGIFNSILRDLNG